MSHHDVPSCEVISLAYPSPTSPESGDTFATSAFSIPLDLEPNREILESVARRVRTIAPSVVADELTIAVINGEAADIRDGHGIADSLLKVLKMLTQQRTTASSTSTAENKEPNVSHDSAG